MQRINANPTQKLFKASEFPGELQVIATMMFTHKNAQHKLIDDILVNIDNDVTPFQSRFNELSKETKASIDAANEYKLSIANQVGQTKKSLSLLSDELISATKKIKTASNDDHQLKIIGKINEVKHSLKIAEHSLQIINMYTKLIEAYQLLGELIFCNESYRQSEYVHFILINMSELSNICINTDDILHMTCQLFSWLVRQPDSVMLTSHFSKIYDFFNAINTALQSAVSIKYIKNEHEPVALLVANAHQTILLKDHLIQSDITLLFQAEKFYNCLIKAKPTLEKHEIFTCLNQYIRSQYAKLPSRITISSSHEDDNESLCKLYIFMENLRHQCINHIILLTKSKQPDIKQTHIKETTFLISELTILLGLLPIMISNLGEIKIIIDNDEFYFNKFLYKNFHSLLVFSTYLNYLNNNELTKTMVEDISQIFKMNDRSNTEINNIKVHTSPYFLSTLLCTICIIDHYPKKFDKKFRLKIFNIWQDAWNDFNQYLQSTNNKLDPNAKVSFDLLIHTLHLLLDWYAVSEANRTHCADLIMSVADNNRDAEFNNEQLAKIARFRTVEIDIDAVAEEIKNLSSKKNKTNYQPKTNNHEKDNKKKIDANKNERKNNPSIANQINIQQTSDNKKTKGKEKSNKTKSANDQSDKNKLINDKKNNAGKKNTNRKGNSKAVNPTKKSKEIASQANISRDTKSLTTIRSAAHRPSTLGLFAQRSVIPPSLDYLDLSISGQNRITFFGSPEFQPKVLQVSKQYALLTTNKHHATIIMNNKTFIDVRVIDRKAIDIQAIDPSATNTHQVSIPSSNDLNLPHIEFKF